MPRKSQAKMFWKSRPQVPGPDTSAPLLGDHENYLDVDVIEQAMKDRNRLSWDVQELASLLSTGSGGWRAKAELASKTAALEKARQVIRAEAAQRDKAARARAELFKTQLTSSSTLTCCLLLCDGNFRPDSKP